GEGGLELGDVPDRAAGAPLDPRGGLEHRVVEGGDRRGLLAHVDVVGGLVQGAHDVVDDADGGVDAVGVGDPGVALGDRVVDDGQGLRVVGQDGVPELVGVAGVVGR